MTTFVDTSALYALLDESDALHAVAAGQWSSLVDSVPLLTHAYVVVESSALVQTRLGWRAVDRLHEGLLGIVEVVAVTDRTHDTAVHRWRQDRKRHLSLVDVTSFVVMEQLRMSRVFAFDRDFTVAGFELVPGPPPDSDVL